MGKQFEFVKAYDEHVYSYLDEVEKNARINLDTCANNMRKALESFVDFVAKENGFSEDDLDKAYEAWRRESKFFSKNNDNKNLKSRLDGLTTAGVLKKLKINQPSLIPCHKHKIALKQTNGKDNYWFVLDQLRNFGNAGSHAEKEKEKSQTALTFDNLVTCLKELHKILKLYFKVNAPSFDYNKMTIKNYEIETYDKNPSDKEQTKCTCEFFGHTKKGAANMKTYVIIRQYNAKDIEEKLLSRNIDFRQLATRRVRSGSIEGIIPYIQRVDEGTGEFALIAYEFAEKPLKLKNLIKSLSIEERCRLCCDIAACFKGIHTNNPPLYHRVLTYESIYVCNYGTKDEPDWLPYLKFDFGKITGNLNSVDLTVIEYAKDAVERLELQSLKKYIHESAFKRADWERVDIYALYVLFGDIMLGEILNTTADYGELLDMDYPTEFLDVWDKMSADDSPSLEEIYPELLAALGDK